MTLNTAKDNTKDLRLIADIIKEETKGKTKVLIVCYDLRHKQECQMMMNHHVEFHGHKNYLDTL